MRYKLLTVGRPSLRWAKAGCEDYLKRLRRHQKLDWEVVRDGRAEIVAERMLAATQGCLRVVLDERGQSWRSVEAAQWVADREMEGHKTLAFMIGGADGHADTLRQKADRCWSLSDLTLQHEVALVVLLEQLYRLGTIRRNEPYHREG